MSLTQTIREVQGRLGVRVDGEAGPETWGAIHRRIVGVQDSAREPAWLRLAREELGQQEIAGGRDNPRIVEYHQATSLRATDDETPWCAAFVNWCLKKAGYRGTNSAAARSFLSWGTKITKPQAGAIVVFSRGAPPAGHVAFYLSHTADAVSVLGGNQGDRVSIARYDPSTILGYRWPPATT